MLLPAKPSARDILLAAFGSMGLPTDRSAAHNLADAFADGMADPQGLFEAFEYETKGHPLIEHSGGRIWRWLVSRLFGEDQAQSLSAQKNHLLKGRVTAVPCQSKCASG